MNFARLETRLPDHDAGDGGMRGKWQTRNEEMRSVIVTNLELWHHIWQTVPEVPKMTEGVVWEQLKHCGTIDGSVEDNHQNTDVLYHTEN